MKVFVTGGAGFIGRRVVAHLVARGDRVTCVVRDPAGAADLGDVEILAGDLRSPDELERQVAGHDAVIHLAGSYRVGISPDERPAMYDANVGTTVRVLDAAIAAGIERIVHVSTVNAFGNTRGEVVDETFIRDPADGFISYYDETKYLAHEAAAERIEADAPIVIAMPGTVIGPGDHSGIGDQLVRAHDGKLGAVSMGELGICPTFVDDEAAGIVAAMDHGRRGEAYVLAGETTRLRDALEIAAWVGGRRLPRLTVPTSALRLAARFGPGVARALGAGPNLAEVVNASAGVTYWASHDKATRELGFEPRDPEAAIRATFAPPEGPG